MTKSPTSEFLECLCDAIKQQAEKLDLKRAQFDTARSMVDENTQSAHEVAASQALVADADRECRNEFHKLVALTSGLECVRQFCNVQAKLASAQIASECFLTYVGKILP